jgi:hypothetical protein
LNDGVRYRWDAGRIRLYGAPDSARIGRTAFSFLNNHLG